MPLPCLNAGNKVPKPHANTGTGGAKDSRPDAVVVIQSAFRQCLALRCGAAALIDAKKARSIHHMPAGKLGDSMPRI